MAARATLLALAFCAALLATAPALGAIVPQQGIAGVRLGMTQAKVRAVLGAAQRTVHGRNELGRFTELRYPGLRVAFQGNTSVSSISTTRTSEKTAGAVGVGSTEDHVRTHVRGVRCKTDFGFRHCFLGQFLAGHRVTDFFIRHGRVTRVDIGFVID